jgi:uncharacterized protein (TIGR03083 family)
MGLNPNERDELLAAAALGDATAQRAIERLDASAELAERAGAFQRAVAALDQLLESPPPAELRARVLDAVAPGQAARESPPVGDLYTRQVDALAALLAELADSDWTQPAHPYRWTVHGLVAHLLVIEDHTAGRLGLVETSDGDEHHLELGAGRIAAELGRAPETTAARWLERATATAIALSDDDLVLPTDVVLHGWPFSIDGAVIARSFEIWTHADDIRRATGRPLVSPIPTDLSTMSGFSVRALPLTLPLVDPDIRLTPTRIVLTGDGGATYDLGDGSDGSDRRTTVVTDVVDYCRMVARRIRVDELECHVEGDGDLARSLLASASVFAV